MSGMTKPNLILPTALWGEVKVAAYRRGCKPVQLVIECLREKYTEGPKKERKQPKVKSEELVEVQSPASDRKVPVPVSDSPVGVPVDASEVPMAKCRKCGELFPVAEMVTEPKSGKLFCGDCVENMRKKWIET